MNHTSLQFASQNHGQLLTSDLVASLVFAGIVISQIVIAVFLSIRRDERRGWSLSCAASEIVGYSTDGHAVYTSSISRFIALLGSVVILWIYCGIGVNILLNDGVTPKTISKDEWFLFWGLALFAPYVANQARAAIVGAGIGVPRDLAPKTDAPAADQKRAIPRRVSATG